MASLQIAPGLAEQVYHAILDDICDGALPPGAHLIQEQLAARFGVSRQPIQQAMALLKADGLVEEVGKRGLCVAALDLNLMRHHYQIRGSLDGLAARLAAERVKTDPAARDELKARGEAILTQGFKAVEDKATRAQIRCDEAFHDLIYDASGNPLLARTVEPHWRFLLRVMSDVLRHAEAPSSIWDQHAAILEAILAGDSALAETLASKHIQIATETLTKALAKSSVTATLN